jgi:hypothetical protein
LFACSVHLRALRASVVNDKYEMTVADSRRLTGPSLLLDRPGAILDVRLDDPARDRAIAGWRAAARRLLDAVQWSA